MKLLVTTDHEAGMTYIHLLDSKPGVVTRTVEMPNGTNVDFNAAGDVCGIEVFGTFDSIEDRDITRPQFWKEKP
jgi:uncharacterized protein YuzE